MLSSKFNVLYFKIYKVVNDLIIKNRVILFAGNPLICKGQKRNIYLCCKIDLEMLWLKEKKLKKGI